MDICNNNCKDRADPFELALSPHAHPKVTVTNVNMSQQHYDAKVKGDEQAIANKLNNDPCLTPPTPKKQPAKLFFKKETKANTDGASTDADACFNEFLARVKLAQQDTRRNPVFVQENCQVSPSNPNSNGIATGSPQRRNSPNYAAMLPEYAKYHEARFQRVISRGNSFGSINNASPSATTPGVEWVADRQSPRCIEQTWDTETLIARHAFPSSIFARHGEEGIPSAASLQEQHNLNYPQSCGNNMTYSPSDLSDRSMHELARRQTFHDSLSIPSAAALSGGSDSSWSEEEQRGVRRFLALLERSPSFASHQHQNHHHPQQQQQQQQQRRDSSSGSHGSTNTSSNCNDVTMVEIAPGVSEPLRKAAETVTAVRNDFYVPVSCFGCSLDIFCIADAKYVICPTCRVVSPMEEGALDGQALVQRGLGLGFTFESLFQIQSDILSER